MKKIFAMILSALLLCGCMAELPNLPETTAPMVETTIPTNGELLTVTFVDVGQADCAILECGGEYMVIDGGNVADSDRVVSILSDMGVEEIHTVVSTHAHEDHTGGLPAVLAVYPTGQVYSPVQSYDSKCFRDFAKYADQQDLELKRPEPGESFFLGNAKITMLGPVKDYTDTNATSIVLRVDFGETSFLFTGDTVTEAEADLLASGADVQADVLKVAHHGSSTSSSYAFLEAVGAEDGIISCETGNSYGHPHEETVDKLEFRDMTLFRTDKLGDITAVSDGEDITFTWQKSGNTPDHVEMEDHRLIGNSKSKKLHLPFCGSLPVEKNRVYFDSMADAVGYTPCSACMG